MAPGRNETVRRLRQAIPALQARGVSEAWLFGSTARNTANDESDIDVAVSFVDPERVTLFTLAGIYADLTDIMGRRVDVVMREEIAAHPRFDAAFRQDAVRVL
jgi:predicted nucleotidyltransferase